MNKAALIDQLAQRTGLSRVQARDVVQTLFSPSDGLIAEELRQGRSVSIHEFGSFIARRNAARQGRDPRTGRPIDIPASTACVFRPRAGLRRSMKDMVGA